MKRLIAVFLIGLLVVSVIPLGMAVAREGNSRLMAGNRTDGVSGQKSLAANDFPANKTGEIQQKPGRAGEIYRIGGFRGVVSERLPDGSIGPAIPGATITFQKEDKSVKKTVQAEKDGRYQVDLTKGRYIVTATHPSYDNFSSAPGFYVVTGSGYQIGNVFMVKQSFTTILLTRHLDYDAVAGPERAQELAHVAEKARVKAIFATNTTRSQNTVQPLAQKLGLTPIIYNYPTQPQDIDGLKNAVLGQYEGKVVLVAGHSDTLHLIIQAFGGDPNHCMMTGPNEFDNLCVITTYKGQKAIVVNLQYGANTQ